MLGLLAGGMSAVGGMAGGGGFGGGAGAQGASSTDTTTITPTISPTVGGGAFTVGGGKLDVNTLLIVGAIVGAALLLGRRR